MRFLQNLIIFTLFTLGLSHGALAQITKVVPKHAGTCSALTPENWAVSTNQQNATFDSYAPDRRSYAGWGVVGVNMMMRQYYGGLYGPPEESLLTIANAVAREIGVFNLQYASPEENRGYFAMRRLQGANGRGLMLYKIYPNGQGQYIESVYLALAQNELGQQGLDMAVGTALSIRCTVQLLPSEAATPTYRTNKGNKKTCEKRSPLSGYNQWLGVQEFHDSLGETHRISVGSTPETNGAEGKGYYAPIRGSNERLQEGRADDC